MKEVTVTVVVRGNWPSDADTREVAERLMFSIGEAITPAAAESDEAGVILGCYESDVQSVTVASQGIETVAVEGWPTA
jgi:hypothetical protein